MPVESPSSLYQVLPWSNPEQADPTLLKDRLDADAVAVMILHGPRGDAGSDLVLAHDGDAERIGSRIHEPAVTQMFRTAVEQRDLTLEPDAAGNPLPGHQTAVFTTCASLRGLSWWCLCAGRAGDGAWDEVKLAEAALLLRLIQHDFEHPTEADLGRILLLPDRLVHEDPRVEVERVRNAEQMNDLIDRLKVVIRQRWPEEMVDAHDRNLVLMRNDRPTWFRLRGRLGPLKKLEVVEMRPVGEEDVPPLEMIEDERVAKAVGLLSDRYAQGMTLEELAKEVDTSPFHFHRLFSRATGISPKHFALRTQLQMAKWKLRTTHMSVSDIADGERLRQPRPLHRHLQPRRRHEPHPIPRSVPGQRPRRTRLIPPVTPDKAATVGRVTKPRPSFASAARPADRTRTTGPVSEKRRPPRLACGPARPYLVQLNHSATGPSMPPRTLRPERNFTMSRRLGSLLLIPTLLLAAAFTGCSADRSSFSSTTTRPTTVSVLDIVSDEVLWKYDVPVGYKLIVDFDYSEQTGEIFQYNEAPADSMTWQLKRLGNTSLVAGYHPTVVPLEQKTTVQLSGNPVLMQVAYRESPELAMDEASARAVRPSIGDSPQPSAISLTPDQPREIRRDEPRMESEEPAMQEMDQEMEVEAETQVEEMRDPEPVTPTEEVGQAGGSIKRTTEMPDDNAPTQTDETSTEDLDAAVDELLEIK